MKNREKTVRYVLIIVSELLTIGNIVRLILSGKFSRLLLAFVTLILILVPEGIERIFHCHISQPMYLVSVLYAIGPMLGFCNNLYYLIPGWDKLLHIMGGVMFVFFGIFLYEILGGDQKKWLLCCVFALCFSMALSVLWEFYEFGVDSLLGMDTQSDSIVHSINSHILNPELGETGSITDIQEVSINGRSLDLGGYLDIGLIDTMMDLLLEALGAVITFVILLLDKNKHPVFQRKENVRIC